MKAETFFTETEKSKISSTIASVEKKTSGEVAVMVVDASDTYPESNVLAGIIAGSLGALLLCDFFFNDSIWYFIPLAAVLAVFFGWMVEYVPGLARYFVLGNRLETMVQRGALQAFYEKNLHQTRDKTGVLFYISLFEHKVWVLADSGINAEISPDSLQRYAVKIAESVKTKNAAEALCHGIEDIGQILAEHFPIKADDTNELSNEVIIG